MQDGFEQYAQEIENGLKHDGFLSCFRSLDEIEEEDATWLIPGWIPEGQITLMAGNGGAGKSTMWVHLAADLSAGRPTILCPEEGQEPMKIAFCTTEDSVKKKLRRKLREAGADLSMITAMDVGSDVTGELRSFKFGSPLMARFIREIRPALCIFDPVQGFIPPDVNMGSRNAMRDCLAPLITLGEEFGTTFIVVCHTNKRTGAYGRDRIADSADLWDISRSVLMCGSTGDDGVRYISQEKNNYDSLAQTVLFSIDDNGRIVFKCRTWKRDREFVAERNEISSKPKLEQASEWIIAYLSEHGGDAKSTIMQADAINAGFAAKTFRNAKDSLKADGKIRYYTTGSKSDKEWHTAIATPFD